MNNMNIPTIEAGNIPVTAVSAAPTELLPSTDNKPEYESLNVQSESNQVSEQNNANSAVFEANTPAQTEAKVAPTVFSMGFQNPNRSTVDFRVQVTTSKLNGERLPEAA
jgi:hypothetical protein